MVWRRPLRKLRLSVGQKSTTTEDTGGQRITEALDQRFPKEAPIKSPPQSTPIVFAAFAVFLGALCGSIFSAGNFARKFWVVVH